MSVFDETWDRPICEFCNEEILYGEKDLHRDGKCVKKYNINDIITKSAKMCEMYD